MKQAYAIAFIALAGNVRCIYKATKAGAINAAAGLVGVQVVAITRITDGANIPHKRIAE